MTVPAPVASRLRALLTTAAAGLLAIGATVLALTAGAAPARGAVAPTPATPWPDPGEGAQPAQPLPISGATLALRLVHTPLSITGADSSGLSVPPGQAAPTTAPGPAPEGSLVGTERTLTIGSGKAEQSWRVRLDVTGVMPIGSTMIAIQTETKVVNGPAGETFRNYNTLFTGSTSDDDTHATAIYDRSSGQSLQVVIDEQGDMVRSDHNTYIDPGVTVTDWEMYPRPKDYGTGTIEYYLPGLGVLTIPVGS